MWTHAIADTVIGLSYFSIPLVLVVLMWRQPGIRFSRPPWLFVPAITLCGVIHLLLIWTLWRPDYGLSALMKAATAAVSLLTAVILWSRLLERGIAAEMRGQVTLDFAATGLDCRICAPLSDRLRVKRERTSA